MTAHMTWLTDDEKRAIYDEALRVLERVGMKLAGSRLALPALADAGAAAVNISSAAAARS